MTRRNLLEFEIRRRVVESLLTELKEEESDLLSELAGILEMTNEDHTPADKDEKDAAFKPVYEQYLEVTQQVVLFEAEMHRLNNYKRRNLLRNLTPAVKREAAYKVIKSLVDRLRQSNPSRTVEDIFFQVAQSLAKKPEDVKRLYYYKPKK